MNGRSMEAASFKEACPQPGSLWGDRRRPHAWHDRV